MRILLTCGLLAATLGLTANAATLQQLTLDDMIQKSTSVVRGTVQVTAGAVTGGYIYTHYTVQVVEQLKGPKASQIDFVVPGGTANGMRQSVAGAPTLTNGQEYVLFLWMSRSGLTHIIGLSQGLFISGNGTMSRPNILDPMVSSNGTEVADPGMQMSLAALRTQVTTVLTGKVGQ